MLKGAIFDMDGLLIDSEPLWKEVEKSIFANVGIELTEDMMNQTTGLKVREVVDYWFLRYPWSEWIFPKSDIAEKINAMVITLIKEKWVWKNGYKHALDFCLSERLQIAICSASNYDLIYTVIEALWIKNYIGVIHSWQDEVFGKPHPAGYTLQKMNLSSNECFALEDSLNGVISVKAARMRCIAIPEERNLTNPKFAIADIILPSLEELDKNIISQL
jgi:mannitol-1-/sugar-/sorbitol-6-/2-deoxyglucose-6-phosphatase